MLVLSRKQGERVCIGEDIEVTVLCVRGNRVKLGFSGPPSTPIHRGEIQERIEAWFPAPELAGCL